MKLFRNVRYRRVAAKTAAVIASIALLLTMPVPVRQAAAGLIDPNLPELVAALLPAVVNITTIRYKAVQAAPDQSGVTQSAESDKSTWFGSGFIVSPEGYVITNKHVVHNGIDFWVYLSDGRRLPADLVAEATGFDIAVIKIRTDKPLPTVKIGDSATVRQGEFVIAIGNPLHYTSTVTTGIISALNRDMHFTPYDDYMQTDAAINQGNSGGPLFNAKGEVIGVNSAIYTTGADTGNIGIGLAIPINDAIATVRHLKDERWGKARLAYIGVRVQSITPDLADAYGLPGPWGSIVLKVMEGTPAESAKLLAGDIITSFEGKASNDSRALVRAIVSNPPGTIVTLGVLRGGKEMKVPVTLTELPPNESYSTFLAEPGIPKPEIPAAALVNFGLQMEAITPELRARYKLDTQQQGAVVTGVAIGSAAADNGINAGSVIVQVRDSVVTSPEDVLRNVEDERNQKHSAVPMLISEPSGLRWVGLPL
jgi:serine protease Do